MRASHLVGWDLAVLAAAKFQYPLRPPLGLELSRAQRGQLPRRRAAHNNAWTFAAPPPAKRDALRGHTDARRANPGWRVDYRTHRTRLTNPCRPRTVSPRLNPATQRAWRPCTSASSATVMPSPKTKTGCGR